MKPTSVVFLIIAALMIVGGLILCSTAEDIALTDNYTLFHETADGGTYVRHDFDASQIKKIELLLTDAEICLYGGADEAYIEFYNFRDGLYTLSESGEVLSLDEIPDIESIFNLQSGFSFSGMRYILRSGTARLGDKKVNVYLPTDAALNILAIEADTCTISAEKIHNQFDLQIYAKESVSIQADNLRTSCTLYTETEHLEMELRSCYLHTLSLKAKTVDVLAEEIYWNILNMDIREGTVNALSTISLNSYKYDIKGKGSLRINNSERTLPYTAGSSLGNTNFSITGDIGEAEITLTELID